jgi:CheY-like chemotaxis protein
MLEKPRVLLVEDDFLISEEVREDLGRFGCEICDTATTTAEALASAVQHQPKQAVVDVGLRHGDSGIEAAERIRHDTGAAIIFLTGRNEPELIRRMRAVGPVAILWKPYDREQLRQAVLDCLKIES